MYEWEDLNSNNIARVRLNMEYKTKEVIKAYKKVARISSNIPQTPGKSGEILEKNDRKPIIHAEYRSILGILVIYVFRLG